MTEKLEDSLRDMLLSCYETCLGAEEVTAFLKQNHTELYNKQVWGEFVDELTVSVKSYNDTTGANLSIGDTDTLYLALGFLEVGDEKGFKDLANKYFDALAIK